MTDLWADPVHLCPQPFNDGFYRDLVKRRSDWTLRTTQTLADVNGAGRFGIVSLDEAGVVHQYEEELTGEAMHGGPVMLAWRDVDESGASADEGYNVVVHEFVHVLDMCDDLERVIALEFYTAAQALEYRQDMLNAARRLAARGDLALLRSKIGNAPRDDAPDAAAFAAETEALMQALATADSFHPSPRVARAFAKIRQHIPFMARDRAMDGDIRMICELVGSAALDAD